jgi:hypothetical protein
MAQQLRKLTLLFLCLFVGSLTGLGQNEQSTSVGGVNVVMRTPWPDSANKGYQPMRVLFENRNGHESDVSLQITGGYDDSVRANRSVFLRTGESREIELLLPAFVKNSNTYQIELTSGVSKERVSGLGSTGFTGNGAHSVAVFSRVVPGTGRDQKWSTALTPASAATSPSSPRTYYGSGTTIPWRNLGLSNDSQWKNSGSVNVTEIAFESMSSNWLAYSSLDLVVVDTSAGLPTATQSGALLTWVRMGGVVLWSGQNVDQALSGLDDARDWVEERFLLDKASRAPSGIRTYQCGFGRILVYTGADLLDGDQAQKAVLGNLRSQIRTEFTPSPRGSRGAGSGLAPNIPGVGILPYRAFVALMVIFAFLVGPINFWYMRKKGTPIKLVLSIPLLAAASSVAILLYGFFWQGVSIRTDSKTVSLLDQRTGLVSTANTRALFAGLAPGRGLVPGQGTGVFPLGEDLVNRSGAIFSIEHGEGTSFGAGYLPSRVQVHQAILSARTSHLRLDFDASGGGLIVRNALDVGVRGLLVHTEDGDWYSLDHSEIEVGGEARLTALASAPAKTRDVWTERGDDDFWTFHPLDMPELPRGSYSALLVSDPFVDDCGVEVEEFSGSHGLLGVMGATR